MRSFLRAQASGGFRVTTRRAVTSIAAAGLVVLSALPAEACSILPPPMPPAPVYVPGESESDYRQRAALHIDGFNALQQQRARDAAREKQLDAWTRARSVAVVEVVRVETDVEIPQSLMGRGVRSTVKPVGWLKGGASVKKRAAWAPFKLAHVGYTSCGASPNWSVFSGKPGDRFVVFLNADAPAQGAVLDVVAPGDIVLAELSIALAAEVRQPK
jgi:hypothetical protein